MRKILDVLARMIVVVSCIVSLLLVSGFLSYIFYSAVMATDWPDWVKYWILH